MVRDEVVGVVEFGVLIQPRYRPTCLVIKSRMLPRKKPVSEGWDEGLFVHTLPRKSSYINETQKAIYQLCLRRNREGYGIDRSTSNDDDDDEQWWKEGYPISCRSIHGLFQVGLGICFPLV